MSSEQKTVLVKAVPTRARQATRVFKLSHVQKVPDKTIYNILFVLCQVFFTEKLGKYGSNSTITSICVILTTSVLKKCIKGGKSMAHDEVRAYYDLFGVQRVATT